MQSMGINLIIKERAAEIGQDLRKLREQKQLTLDEISNELKIRKFYLEKIEDGDIQNIPGIAYQRMYLKSYCNFLDLSLNYNQKNNPANENIQSPFSSLKHNNLINDSQLQSRTPSKSTIIFCVALLIIFLLFFGSVK